MASYEFAHPEDALSVLDKLGCDAIPFGDSGRIFGIRPKEIPDGWPGYQTGEHVNAATLYTGSGALCLFNAYQDESHKPVREFHRRLRDGLGSKGIARYGT